MADESQKVWAAINGLSKQQQAEASARNHVGRIGASRAPAILGLDPWCTPYDAWLEIRGEAPDSEAGEAAHWGTVLEEVVVREGYERTTGQKTRRVNRTLRHPLAPFLTCHLDRRVVPVSTRTVLQIKCRDRFVRDRWGPGGSDGVPAKEAAQVRLEMAIANRTLPGGIERADVGVLFGGNTFEVYHLERAKDDPIVDDLAAWWNRHIDGGLPPDPVNPEDCRKRWAATDGSSRELSYEEKGLVESLLHAEEQGKLAEERRDALRLQLMKAIGESEALVAEGKPIVSWRESTSFDAKAFAVAEPDIALQCTKLDAAAVRKGYPKLYAEHKTQTRRGNLTVNRAAARKLLDPSN